MRVVTALATKNELDINPTMKRPPFEIYDHEGKTIDDAEFVEYRKRFSLQFKDRFRGMAVEAARQDRSMVEVIEAAFIQGIAFAVMPRKTDNEPEGS